MVLHCLHFTDLKVRLDGAGIGLGSSMRWPMYSTNSVVFLFQCVLCCIAHP
jgi:hypothetical protein